MPFFRKSEEERPPKAAQELLERRAAVEKAQLPEAAAASGAEGAGTAGEDRPLGGGI